MSDCAICLKPCSAPMISAACGHGGCAICLKRWIEGCHSKGVEATCMHCRTPITQCVPNYLVVWDDKISEEQKEAVEWFKTFKNEKKKDENEQMFAFPNERRFLKLLEPLKIDVINMRFVNVTKNSWGSGHFRYYANFDFHGFHPGMISIYGTETEYVVREIMDGGMTEFQTVYVSLYTVKDGQVTFSKTHSLEHPRD